jgi:hypothetical protein
MARDILSVSLTAPSSNVTGVATDTFTMTATITEGGHGATNPWTIHRQYRINGGAWQDIPVSGGSLTTPSNGDTFVTGTLTYSSTVTLQSAGEGQTLELRALTKNNGVDSFLDPSSGWLTVTVQVPGTTEQTAFQFVADDGNESGSTLLGTINTAYEGDRGPYLARSIQLTKATVEQSIGVESS